MTGTDQPLVSVLMPYYNGRAFMREAVQSVLDQTYHPIEIVIIDDASPNPEDAQYIEALTQELGLRLIKHSTNQGLSRTMAHAFAISRGTLIAELSQDDLYRPDKIQRQVEALTSYNWDAVYAAGDIMYQSSGKIEPRRVEKIRAIIESGRAVEHLQQQNLPGISIQGLLAKRSVFERDIVPIWRDFLLDDWPVHIRLFERYQVGLLNGPLWRSRAHQGNSSWGIWTLLGPQIEVVARMTPVQRRADAVGNRLTSLARRLHKQKGDAKSIVRLTLAGLMLVDSLEQRTKAQRILNRIPGRTKRSITGPKQKQIEAIRHMATENDHGQASDSIGWQALGKTIAQSVKTRPDHEKLLGIGWAFAALSVGLLQAQSFDIGVKTALCALMLLDDPKDEARITQALHALQWQSKDDMLEEKLRLLKAQGRFHFRSLVR